MRDCSIAPVSAAEITGASLWSEDCLRCSLAEESLRLSGTLRMQAMGWSMMPTLWPEDILEIEGVAVGSVGCGDIVLFSRDHRLFVHRVLYKAVSTAGELRFTTQGDGMPHPDPQISATDILGKVRWISRGEARTKPDSRMSFVQRVLCALVRHSGLAFRVFARLHDMSRGQQQVTACPR